MDDIANLSYGALPERLYVVLDGTIVYEVGRVTFLLSYVQLYSCFVGR